MPRRSVARMGCLVLATAALAACGDEGSAPTVDALANGPRADVSALGSGYTTVTERPFSATQESGWWLYRTPNFHVVADPSAPRSPGHVGRATMPAGTYAGEPSMVAEYDLRGLERDLHLTYWLKLSANYNGHATGVNRTLTLWMNGRPVVGILAHGSGSGPLRPAILLQGIANRNGLVNALPNVVPSATVKRGQWQRWDVRLHRNTDGLADGSVEWWIDGQKVGALPGIAFVGAGTRVQWDLLQWNPTWGGNGGRLPAAQYQWIDHLVLGSAANAPGGGTGGDTTGTGGGAGGDTTGTGGGTGGDSTGTGGSGGDTTVAVASVTVAAPSTSLVIGSSMQLSAQVRDANGAVLTGRAVTWSSSASSVASVTPNGFVVASSVGVATITATSEGRSGSVTITVTNVPVAQVSVASPADSVNVGGSLTLVATLRDASGNVLTGRSITWSSSSASIASVSSAGVLTAVSPGTVSITATSEGRSGSATVVVRPLPPAPVASVSVSGSNALLVGQTAQLSATLRDASGAVLTGRPVTWSSSAGSVASVSSSGSVSALAAGSATITASSEGRSGTLTITVSAPPPPPSGSAEYPNMPGDFAQLTSRSFATMNDGGWANWGVENLGIVSDPTAPKSGPNVGEARFPAGYAGGDGPISTEADLGGTRSQLYVSFWMKLSSNWYGHPTGVNKIFHIFIGGSNRVYLSATGAGTGALKPQVRLQGVPMGDGAVNLEPNLVPTSQIVRGRWQRWEVLIRANTGGGANGLIEFWIDGVKVGSHPNVAIVTSSQRNTFELLQWNPTWGGIGSTLPAAQTMSMDHIYAGGR